MKNITTILIMLCLSTGCKQGERMPVNVEYFKTGDVLMPDYAIADTMIVINAAELNKGMALIEQGFIDPTDSEISDLFYKYCEIYSIK